MDRDYSDALQQEGRDLVAASRDGVLAPPRHRDDEIARVIALLQQGRSVLLVGPAGVGKSAVVHGVAARFAQGQPARGLVELSSMALMSGTRYLGEWQTKVSAMVDAAVRADTTLFFSDVWNLPTAGRTSNSDTNVLDALRPHVEQGRLSLLAEATPEILRQMQRVPRFADLFQGVELRPLTAEQVDQTLATAAADFSLQLDAAGRRALVELTRRFLPARPQPGPALALLSQVAERAADLPAGAPVPPAFVEQVFADRAGLPAFIVSPSATMKAEEIRAAFAERMVGQAHAIASVVECIALFKAGLQDPGKPLGTFLFVGPTGVGKTELARTLARFLFGSADRLLRFDLGEYKDFHSFELLLGNPRDPTRPAALVDPVRAQPFQVILFDELEKAHPNVWDVLLGLLDEGRLTPPAGEAVDFRSTIVICTSNVGAAGSDKRLGFGEGPDLAQREATIRADLERHFRPELLNRFQQVVVFHPLNREQVRAVARQELSRVLRREGITARGLVVDVDDDALDLVIDQGYDERYGARALKRQLQRMIVLPLALRIMESAPTRGQLIRVDVAAGSIRVRLRDTPDSRAVRREAQPVKVDGERFTKADLTARVHQVQQAAAALAQDADRAVLREERDRLVALRTEPDFWKYPTEAAQALRDLHLAERDLARLARLQERADSCAEDLAVAAGRDDFRRLASRLLSLEDHLHHARRELVVLGRTGHWDALVELRPVGATGPAARDLLHDAYTAWGQSLGHGVELLLAPRGPEDACLLAIRGPYASGLLADEAGLHRLRQEDGSSVCRVRVAPWTDAHEQPVWGDARALKATSPGGVRLRSRLEVRWKGQGRRPPLVLQGDRTLDQARALAEELLGSWARMPAASDRRVRRYDAEAGQVKDHRLGILNVHPSRITGDRLHRILCDRVDER